MSAAAARRTGPELVRYLELQNLGLNLPFAVAFLIVAARWVPAPLPVALILLAFLAARNAGHSFNRWSDRDLDARNPRTQGRALVTGRFSARFALLLAAGSALVLVLAAYLLNPLAFLLSFVALAVLFGYSYTKRHTAWTTPFLGLVEAIVPAAVFIGLDGTLPLAVLFAVGGLLLWGTAFETIHSLGDLESDRELGLRSLPVRLGRGTSLNLLPPLHLLALGLLAGFGLAEALPWPYFLGLAARGAIALATDAELRAAPTATLPAFRRHFVMAALFLAGTAAAAWVAAVPPA